jgi:cytochrome b involved in lipid metabolism
MKTFIVILVLIVILVGSYLMWGRGDETKVENVNSNVPAQNSASTTPTATTTNSGPQNGIAAIYTSAQVATHNNSKDCWAAVNGNVYNLTSWISKHPGGEQAILSICGKDATVAFNGQHGGQTKPENILSTFFIGTLKLP